MDKNVVASFVEEISEFKGELANEYKTRQEYVKSGAFEKDYFASWLEGCSDYPYLCEIIEFCQYVDAAIQEWLNAVEDGSIDPEAGWAE